MKVWRTGKPLILDIWLNYQEEGSVMECLEKPTSIWMEENLTLMTVMLKIENMEMIG
jgi:hypothetical protein